MTTIDSVTITTNDPKHGMHRVKVGDLDISNATTGAVISIKPGELPAVTVDLMVWEALAPVDGPAEVTVPDDTAAALVALGWTPPAPAGEPASVPAEPTAGPDEVVLPKSRIAELEEDSAWLAALRTAGVDNWNGYDYACELLRENEES